MDASMKKEVLGRRKRILGDDHPDIISAINHVAATCYDEGELDEATCA